MLPLLLLVPMSLCCTPEPLNTPLMLHVYDDSASVCFSGDGPLSIYTFPCIGTVNAFINVNEEASKSNNVLSRKWVDGSDTSFFTMGLSEGDTDDVVHVTYQPASDLTHPPNKTRSRVRVVASTDPDFLDARIPNLPNDGNMETTLVDGEQLLAEVTLDFAPSVVGAVDTYEVWTRSGLIDNRAQTPILPCGLDSLFTLDEAATAALNQSRVEDGGATGVFQVTHTVESTSDEPFFIAVRVRRTFAGEGEYDAIYRWQRIGDSASSLALSLTAVLLAFTVHLA